ncbi:hypothetical protein AB0A94_31945 [Streptomyces sp. NPDC044984]|uniref:hypothetical protein n=1 Tax=Streptomyces sp. NPDC044984 TaxID=3154335 RepID=UPI0033FC9288
MEVFGDAALGQVQEHDVVDGALDEGAEGGATVVASIGIGPGQRGEGPASA